MPDYLLEIQGESVAFTGAQNDSGPVTWSQSLLEAIIKPPPIMTMDVGPYDGTFGNGGMGVGMIECASYVQDRKTSPVTTLTADVTVGATTINVADTSAFPTSGAIWIDQEAYLYSGKTATTFTGCTPASYGTWEAAHTQTLEPANAKTEVYGFNPTLHGRKCWIHEFDPRDPSNTKVTIAVGYLDGLEFSDTGFTFHLLSVAQQLENQSIATGLRASGSVLGSLERVRNHKVIHTKFSEKATSDDLIVELDDTRYPFPYDDSATAGSLVDVDNCWLMVGSEVMLARKSAYPAFVRPVNNVDVSSFGPRIQTIVPPYLRLGHTIRFTDSATSKVINTTIVKIEGHYITHAAVGYAPAVASTWDTPDLQLLTNFERAKAETKAEDHDAGTEVKQVWVQEADHVDSVLQLLHSSNGSNNAYDTLPDWVGAGVRETEIDTDSFDVLRPYSTPIVRVLDEPLAPKQALVHLAHVTGGRIFVSEDGKVTARRDFAEYPDTDSAYSLDIDEATKIPLWRTDTGLVYNHWSWNMRGVAANFRMERSTRKYRERKFPEVSADFLVAGVSLGLAEAVAVSTLMRYDLPTPEITVEIPEESSNILQPGQNVSVTFLWLPDQAGGEGITSGLYEVVEFSPNGSTVSLRLLRLPQQGNVGLVAPAALVQGVSGSDVTLKSSSSTHLAPTQSKLNTPIADILGTGEDGTEDVDWFRVNDPVQIIDASTLGNATPTTANTTITSVNYTTRVIQLGSKPAWLAADDIIRLATYATTKAGANQSLRTPYFLFWANNTPAMPGGDDPYVWGM